MERIVYVQEDHFEIPEELLKLSHEELRKRIAEEREKEIEKKTKQLEKIKDVRVSEKNSDLWNNHIQKACIVSLA